MHESDKVVIMMVEDDPGHALLIEKNLRRAGVSNQLIHFTDGEQALDYLFLSGEYEGKPNKFPLVILLDLNMPVVDGYQVLARIKGDERTKNIPIVILTTTDNPQEVAKCYELGCNVYVTKPVEYMDFSQAIQSLGFFLSVIKIPER